MTIKWFDLVADTSTTTGTGTFTVSGTPPSLRRTLSAVLSVNDEFIGRIEHQSANEWEVGVYTYSAANQFTRSGRILASSNAGAAVNFSAGTKNIAMVLAANWGTREVLAANRTYYVRTDGSNSNTGLVNSAGGAFATWQYAVDLVQDTLDFNGFTVTIQAGASGTWTAGATVTGWVGGGALSLIGDASSPVVPSNVVINASATAFATDGFIPYLYIGGFDIRSSAGYGVNHFGIGYLYLGTNIYGVCASGQIIVYGIGRYCGILSNYTINGDSPCHIRVSTQAYIYAGAVTVTITGARTFTTFVIADNLGIYEGANTWNVGTSVAGKRFDVFYNAIIAAASSLTHFPGDVAGTISLGGIYWATNYGRISWTPALTFATGGTAGITYSFQEGSYIRIGDFVYADFRFTLTSNGTGSGRAWIDGLPLTPATPGGGAVTGGAGWSFTGSAAFALVAYTDGNIYLEQVTTTGQIDWDETNISDGMTLVGYVVFTV